jgi:hypothetical protein
MVLECAVNAEAKLVVTGDNDILALEFFRDIRIVTPDISRTPLCIEILIERERAACSEA